MELSFFIAASNQLRAYAKTEETAASLSRVYQHTNERNIGALTAFRSEYSLKENRERNEELKKAIRDGGYGYIKVKGRYIENLGTDKETPVDEESFIVVGDSTDEGKNKLNKFLSALGKKFDQDSILFKPYDNKSASLVFTTGEDAGSTLEVGEWSPTNIGEYFSVLGKGKSFEFKKKPKPEDKLLNPESNSNEKELSPEQKDWWDSLSKNQQENYIAHHPESKYKDHVKTE